MVAYVSMGVSEHHCLMYWLVACPTSTYLKHWLLFNLVYRNKLKWNLNQNDKDDVSRKFIWKCYLKRFVILFQSFFIRWYQTKLPGEFIMRTLREGIGEVIQWFKYLHLRYLECSRNHPCQHIDNIVWCMSVLIGYDVKGFSTLHKYHPVLVCVSLYICKWQTAQRYIWSPFY